MEFYSIHIAKSFGIYLDGILRSSYKRHKIKRNLDDDKRQLRHEQTKKKK